jgi:hypothetical protein
MQCQRLCTYDKSGGACHSMLLDEEEKSSTILKEFEKASTAEKIS